MNTHEPTPGAVTDVCVVTSLEQFDAVADEWSALVECARPGDEMYHDPQVVRAQVARGEVQPRFVVIRRNGRIQGIAPLVLQPTSLKLRLSVIEIGSVSVRALRLLGDRVLLREGTAPEDVLRPMFRQIDAWRASFDVLWIYSQRTDDPLLTFLTSSPGRLSFRPVIVSAHTEKVRGVLFDRPVAEYLAEVRTHEGFPGKTIRRFWRDAREGTELIRVTGPEQVADFLQCVHQVYNASWQARTYGERRRDDEKDIAAMTELAAFGFLRSYVLREQGLPIAFVLGYQYRGRYSYAETGYDSRRAAVSPGSVLTCAVIEDLFRVDPPRELDFGFGDGAYKRTFGNTSYDVCSLYVVRRGRWRLLLAAQQMLNTVDQLGRAAVTRVGFDRVVRRRLKRQVKAGA